MRLTLRTHWSILVILGAVAACSSDRKHQLAEDSLSFAVPGSDLGKEWPAPGTPGVRNPNLGPPPASLPDSFGGVVPGAAAVLKTTTKQGLGTYLTDSVGRPLYMSDADQGGASSCRDNCALTFRPVFAPSQPPKAAEAPIRADMISSFERPDFPPPHRQLRYNGMPLYYYDADAGNNFTAAQGIFVFGAHWYLVTPDGQGLGKKAAVDYLGTGTGRGGQ